MDGQVICNGIRQIMNTAFSRYGFGFVPDGLAMPDIESARLKQVFRTGARHTLATTYSTRATDSRPKYSRFSLRRSGRDDGFPLQHVGRNKAGASAKVLKEAELPACSLFTSMPEILSLFGFRA